MDDKTSSAFLCIHSSSKALRSIHIIVFQNHSLVRIYILLKTLLSLPLDYNWKGNDLPCFLWRVSIALKSSNIWIHLGSIDQIMNVELKLPNWDKKKGWNLYWITYRQRTELKSVEPRFCHIFYWFLKRLSVSFSLLTILPSLLNF
jgi:hypothetical protein